MSESKHVCAILEEGAQAEGLRRFYRDREGFDLTVVTNALAAFSDQASVDRFWAERKPWAVICGSVLSAGIAGNQARPAELGYANMRLIPLIIQAAYRQGVERLLYLASSCIYPRECPQPMKEEMIGSGPLEPTSQTYAAVKLAGQTLVSAYRKQYGFSAVTVVPATVYGPGETHVGEHGHVLGSLLHRFLEAKERGMDRVVLWGSGRPRREFLFSDDFAVGCHFILENWPQEDILNLGVGEDVSIAELAERLARAVGFEGRIEWDASRPDGAPRKLLDSRRVQALGWRPRIGLDEGLRLTLEGLKSSPA